MTEYLSGRYWWEIGGQCPLKCEVRTQENGNGRRKNGFVKGKLLVEETAHGFAFFFHHRGLPGRRAFVSRPDYDLTTPLQMGLEIRRSND